MTVLWETDWLGSNPVFYHEITGSYSANINDVIDYANMEFDPEGFNNYLDFGYSILGRTPIKHVRFVGHSTQLCQDERKCLIVRPLDDSVASWNLESRREDDIVELLREQVNGWEHAVDGQIVIPTSGGYDSRLLNFVVGDKTRIRAFTYGLSRNQEESSEVKYAQEVARRLGIRWEPITLGGYHAYLRTWYDLFGPSVHAHGMYQIEFYNEIVSKGCGKSHLLSGLVGDAMAGSLEFPVVTAIDDVRKLGISHGVVSDSEMSLLPKGGDTLHAYVTTQSERLGDPVFRIIEALRMKMILLCYLLRVPESVGFVPHAPYINQQLAEAMLTLPADRRKNRLWQREFFQDVGLDVENAKLEVDPANCLDMWALRQSPLEPLDEHLLSEVILPEYVRWTNSVLRWPRIRGLLSDAMRWPHFWRCRPLAARFALPADCVVTLDTWRAYFAHMTLWPIQEAMRRRDNARAGKDMV